MSIVHWGDIHMVDSRGRPMVHEHKNCGKMFDPVMVCSECGEPLSAKDVHVHMGPGTTERKLRCLPGRRLKRTTNRDLMQGASASKRTLLKRPPTASRY